MAHRIDVELAVRLEQAKRANRRMRIERAQLMHALGKSVEEIAHAVKAHPTTVTRWLQNDFSGLWGGEKIDD